MRLKQIYKIFILNAKLYKKEKSYLGYGKILLLGCSDSNADFRSQSPAS